MNLGDAGDSPWSDVQSINSQDQHTSQDQDANKASSAQDESSHSTATPSTPGGRPARTGPRRYGTQPTRLEAVDDSLGPLGPLGSSSFDTSAEPDEPPALPQKETLPIRSARPPSSAASKSSRSREGAEQDDDEHRPSHWARAPPPVQSPPSQSTQRQMQPSMSVEQAARPTFKITVGDPHKVGDLTSGHTVYQVRTKTTSKAYRSPDFEVSRRYRDFLWLYNQLHSNNPGVVVPPPPEKQAMGRFDTDFVESRRSALERMLNKTAAHVILQHDADLKLFLESDSFNMDVKQREKKDPDMPVESKGVLGGLGLSVGSGSKFIEHDDWFLDRRVYLDTLESQLKALLRSTEAAVAQRKALSDACAELSTALTSLAQVELSPSLTGPLASLSDLQMRVRELYARQAQQDELTLGNVIDEYIRLIGSIKKAFEQRQRSWQLWHTAETDLQKRRSALDKLARQGRSQQDRISQLQADVSDAERRAHQARLAFDDLGKGMRGELERFEREKVEDFRSGVETFLESSVEAQKELIELWETYLMRLDADTEDETGAAGGAGAGTFASGLGSAPTTGGGPGDDADNKRLHGQQPIPDARDDEHEGSSHPVDDRSSGAAAGDESMEGHGAHGVDQED